MTPNRIVLLTAGFLLTPLSRPALGPTAILGWWHGTSICTRAEWNSACNDEVILYEFVPLPRDSDAALLHPWKIVDGKPDPMGDLPFRYSPDSASWNGDFANGRVDLRWTYQIRGDTLYGQVLLRPTMRVGRQVIAIRGKGRNP